MLEYILGVDIVDDDDDLAFESGLDGAMLRVLTKPKAKRPRHGNGRFKRRRGTLTRAIKRRVRRVGRLFG